MKGAILHSAFDNAHRSNWVRLRTLIYLRSIAALGQAAAILVGYYGFGLALNLGWCFVAVGAAAISNIVPLFIFPGNKRLSESEMLAILLFDITQLSCLLFLTGGMHNPFALLILAPVTISATALQLRSTVLVSGVAILAMTLVTWWYIPLATQSGYLLEMPEIFVFGFWTAVMIGILFLAAYARRVTSEVNAMADALVATQLALSREQKLTDLGGVVAATAHELGTPLATIKLVSGEMLDDIEDPDLRDDILLIAQQADRCRDILRSMGRAGKDDLHLRTAPIATVVQEAAEPHGTRGKTIVYHVAPLPGADERQPEIYRRPEIIHGLRNLVQNAVDFASTTVRIDITWSKDQIRVRIADDGPGYPAHVLPRLGDPFLRSRGAGDSNRQRPGYEGMGLGLFIAKTLLERSGAELSFANGREDGPGGGQPGASPGAIVESLWRHDEIALSPRDGRIALGLNRQIETP
ncbi:sensor histidine kinase RegB [Oceaniglobus trochenteri]|uniref:sensor histidine kinase RegB n=1 Tax=Oceaniglobus trochenteri TaxID=2763260 RepID=UPI001CFFEB81|nr:ActS/PrrB/RegB family redox-sensitive histidine kinase [Oceaniglobus trochenteri]